MFNTRVFNNRLDFEWLEEVIKERDLDSNLLNTLPELGVIVTYAGERVAAGFLRAVEGGFFLSDSLITDPCVPKDIRNQALDLVINEMTFLAKQAGVNQLIGLTLDSNTLQRSIRLGYVQVPYNVVALDLSKDKAG